MEDKYKNWKQKTKFVDEIYMNLLTKIVNTMPKEVISKYDAQYGILATVFRATHGVYIVIPIMNTFLAMKVPDAILRTNLLLNLQQKKIFI